MENRGDKLASTLQHWKEAVKEPTSTSKSKSKSTSSMKQIFPKWKMIFACSCVFAVSLDPLFYFIPIIDEDKKCFRLERNLKTTALILRSVTDVFYIVDIIFQVCAPHEAETFGFPKSVNDALGKAKRILRPAILIDILAVLPLPQVVIFYFSLRMRSSKFSNTWKFLSILAILQYVPRILRTYQSWMELDINIGIWVKGALSFIPVILASHVLGALWYFLAIQREIDCWQFTCRSSENGCEPNTFKCDDQMFRNITILNDLCPINPTNATLFDFGIYLNALQFGMNTMESKSFFQQLLYCFWWGLRNLSSMGQNLETSINPLENIFAVVIFFLGILVFVVYVNGILQVIRDQLENDKTKKLREEMVKSIDIEAQMWLSRNGLPKNLKNVIMENVKLPKENKAVNAENFLSFFPLEFVQQMKGFICLDALKKVPAFQTVDEVVLKAICGKLKPVMYAEGSYIIQKGEHLKMFLILQGIAGTYKKKSSDRNTTLMKKGDFYGEELAIWASNFAFPSHLPISTEYVKPLIKVEAFVLTANDLENVFSKFWWLFSRRRPTDSGMKNRFEKLAAYSLVEGFLRLRRRRRANLRLNDEVRSHNFFRSESLSILFQ